MRPLQPYKNMKSILAFFISIASIVTSLSADSKIPAVGSTAFLEVAVVKSLPDVVGGLSLTRPTKSLLRFSVVCQMAEGVKEPRSIAPKDYLEALTPFIRANFDHALELLEKELDAAGMVIISAQIDDQAISTYVVRTNR